jgi:hypothetical protein
VPLISGQVIRLLDTRLHPGRLKRHICVCPQRRLFLRINTEPHWPPHHRLHHDRNREILDWDSYVELHQLHRFPQAEIARATLIGRMSRSEARELAWSASRAPTSGTNSAV